MHLISLFLVIITISYINGCNSFCPQDYSPICASNGNLNKTFTNNCELDSHNCKNPNDVYQTKYLSECKYDASRCDKYCGFENEPICAFNGSTYKTFFNLCDLERNNCLENEAFVPKFNRECWNYNCKEQNCPYVYQPICAYDGVTHKTFANQCFLHAYNCPRNFYIMEKRFDGECGSLLEGRKCFESCYENIRFSQICAFNGTNYKEFTNRCEYAYYNCENNYEMEDANNMIDDIH